jgi:hypothetical protein
LLVRLARSNPSVTVKLANNGRALAAICGKTAASSRRGGEHDLFALVSAAKALCGETASSLLVPDALVRKRSGGRKVCTLTMA